MAEIERALRAKEIGAKQCGLVDRKLRAIINRYRVASGGGDPEKKSNTYCDDAVGDCSRSEEGIRGHQIVQAVRGQHPANPSGLNARRALGSGKLWLTECTITYCGKPTYTPIVGGILIGPEGIHGSVRACPSKLDIQWVLDFDPCSMEMRLREYLDGKRFQLPPQLDLRDPQVLGLVQALQCDIEQGCPAGSLFAEMIGGALSVYLAQRCSGNSPNSDPFKGGLPSPRLNRVLEYIQANLDQDIHIDEIAGAAGLSSFHFSKLFKRSTGSSPHQYILQRRLERARELLRKTDLSLCEIALQSGFADQSHLTNVFRRFIGVTPSKFRTLLRISAAM